MARPNSTDAESLFQSGNSLLSNRQYLDALACYQDALSLRPEHPETLANLGVTCAELGRWDEALSWYDAAIRVRPRYPEAHYNRGNALHSAKRFGEAVTAYDTALQIEPQFAPSWNNRGLTLMRLGRANDAVASYRKALKLKPSYSEARNNLGLASQILGQVDEAIRHFNESIRLQPTFASAHSNRAQAWLLKGDFALGLVEYEWRWQIPRYKLAPRNLPIWDRSPLEGRSILLRHEQGLGDTLQFVRYAAMVKEFGGRVVLECPASLHPLLESFEGVDRLVERGASDAGCDYQVPLLSLPGLFRTDLETIPSRVPYLRASPDRIERWRARLPRDRRLIGICWQGNPDFSEEVFRSIPLAEFAPLARVPDVQLIALQKGYGTSQIEAFRERQSLLDLGDDFDAEEPFLDTAAVMPLLDLVITSDTSIAHLAGALGRPVWIALSVGPEWRWLLDRNDSPWYPSARLFRQSTLGDWTAVFAKMANSLANER
jgi:Flp pilus assembly protein TadD